MIFKSALNRALGIGSAKSGIHHWLFQRITALALIPLSLWFVGLFIVFIMAPYELAILSFKNILNATLAILFIGITFYHGALGMQVIWEDYIHCEGVKWFVIILTKLTSLFLGVLSILSILKIYVG